MIDLHLHLDGSLSPQWILAQAKKDGIPLPADNEKELLSFLSVGENCSSLNEYLEKFQLPLSLLQTEDAVEQAVYRLLKDLSFQKLDGVEIRFAPQLHCEKGLSQEAVVEAALSGLSLGMRDFPIQSGLILCTMRGMDNDIQNKKAVSLASVYRQKGVLALDLAGAEALFPTSNYEELFLNARKSDIPFTIHAGEAAGPESIEKALDFGACRIGHGVRCVESPALVERLVKEQIPLEICPISNIQTKAVSSCKEHPALKLLELGIPVTINTDNMTVSNTTLQKEFRYLRDYLGMTDSQETRLHQNAQKASFLF